MKKSIVIIVFVAIAALGLVFYAIQAEKNKMKRIKDRINALPKNEKAVFECIKAQYRKNYLDWFNKNYSFLQQIRLSYVNTGRSLIVEDKDFDIEAVNWISHLEKVTKQSPVSQQKLIENIDWYLSDPSGIFPKGIELAFLEGELGQEKERFERYRKQCQAKINLKLTN
jgi:hypothetical protein